MATAMHGVVTLHLYKQRKKKISKLDLSYHPTLMTKKMMMRIPMRKADFSEEEFHEIHVRLWISSMNKTKTPRSKR